MCMHSIAQVTLLSQDTYEELHWRPCADKAHHELLKHRKHSVCCMWYIDFFSVQNRLTGLSFQYWSRWSHNLSCTLVWVASRKEHMAKLNDVVSYAATRKLRQCDTICSSLSSTAGSFFCVAVSLALKSKSKTDCLFCIIVIILWLRLLFDTNILCCFCESLLTWKLFVLTPWSRVDIYLVPAKPRMMLAKATYLQISNK